MYSYVKNTCEVKLLTFIQKLVRESNESCEYVIIKELSAYCSSSSSSSSIDAKVLTSLIKDA